MKSLAISHRVHGPIIALHATQDCVLFDTCSGIRKPNLKPCLTVHFLGPPLPSFVLVWSFGQQSQDRIRYVRLLLRNTPVRENEASCLRGRSELYERYRGGSQVRQEKSQAMVQFQESCSKAGGESLSPVKPMWSVRGAPPVAGMGLR